MTQRVLILGAAGRDFHNFNVYFRDNADYEVVAFTATQIPNIDGRRYPPELAGKRYPKGIPIESESELTRLIRRLKVDVAVFSYSDVPHERVMNIGSQVSAAGADFLLLGAKHTMLKSKVPMVAVCAVRTGCGKSQTSRRIAAILRKKGKQVVLIRHPMPYGDLVKQAVQRFETYEDLEKHDVTIEEREEYEPHIAAGCIVYAGVDYKRILRKAEKEADVIIWDGGNNDTPFYTPDLFVTVVDPHRPDHALRYHPGETNVRMADVLVINKIGTADLEQVETARRIVSELNPGATIVEAASPLFVKDGSQIRGKKVLVIEDGPTLTHGEMAFGAAWVAARKYGAAEIIDPRPYAVGSIKDTFEKYTTTGAVLPAMGYGEAQTRELAETIANTPAELVLVGTPIDLRRLIDIKQPALRVRYELQEIGEPTLETILKQKLG
jgi:predicted GTPase